jgi:hypothetical protein
LPAHPADQVNSVIDQELARFAPAPIRDFVPLLVERLARNDLRHPQDPINPLARHEL